MSDFKLLSVIESAYGELKNTAVNIKKAHLLISIYDTNASVRNKNAENVLGTVINAAILKGSVKFRTLNNVFEKHGNPEFDIEEIFNMLGFTVEIGIEAFYLSSKYSLEQILVIEKLLKEETSNVK